MKKSNNKFFNIKLHEREIAILKASLQFYLIDFNLGASTFMMLEGASWGSSDGRPKRIANGLIEQLDRLSKVEPEYESSYSLERMIKMSNKEYKLAKKRTDKINGQTMKQLEEDIANKKH